MLREILVISFIFLFVSCSSTNEIVTNNKSDVALYREGMNLLRKKEFDSAVEIFTELEIVHPYSSYSSKSQIMAGFAQYMSNQYEEAILTLSKFIELNPDHSSVPYALYLKAYSYYERMPDVNFDQRTSERALEEFTELINKYPKSKYAKKSKKHVSSLNNHLAAQEVKIGKFYQSQGFYLAGIKRYKKILSDYKKSSHIPEAIFRLIECYSSLGLNKQSVYLFKILKYNFPKTSWVKEGGKLIKKNSRLGSFKKEELDLKNLKIDDFDLM